MNNSTRSINELVEVIIEKGVMTADEQVEINQQALRGQASREDSSALQRLTNLINEGKINVQ